MPPSVRRDTACPWKLPFSAGELESLLAAMLTRAGRSGTTVELVVLDDREMEDLHANCLDRAGPTNVLAFPFAGGVSHGPGSNFLGSLALSVDTLLRECFLYDQEPAGHCIRLLAHGLGHLLGHEHGPGMDGLTEELEQAGFAACPQPDSPAPSTQRSRTA